MSRHENIVYECDRCGDFQEAEIVTVGEEKTDQAIMPRGWIKLGGKVRLNSGGKPVELKGDYCSAECVLVTLDNVLEAS